MRELSHKEWVGKAAAIRFRDKAFIDGKPVPARSGRTFASINPVTERRSPGSPPVRLRA
ncbi:hypothetical protein [Mesorhizobium sp.]|uniref:hypothetical protein n=1 Tax=Mesorhizobium sp. TaxID=1871066 RepID=UPI0025D60C04|nr:hypothetical protein [Mesorhizobium sp.]